MNFLSLLAAFFFNLFCDREIFFLSFFEGKVSYSEIWKDWLKTWSIKIPLQDLISYRIIVTKGDHFIGKMWLF